MSAAVRALLHRYTLFAGCDKRVAIRGLVRTPFLLPRLSGTTMLFVRTAIESARSGDSMFGFPNA